VYYFYRAVRESKTWCGNIYSCVAKNRHNGCIASIDGLTLMSYFGSSYCTLSSDHNFCSDCNLYSNSYVWQNLWWCKITIKRIYSLPKDIYEGAEANSWRWAMKKKIRGIVQYRWWFTEKELQSYNQRSFILYSLMILVNIKINVKFGNFFTR